MALSKISGNQISTSTEAIITTLTFLNSNSVFRLPAGTQAQRPSGVSIGTLRFNTDTDAAEIYKADDGSGSAGWAAVSGGGPSLGEDSVIRTNQNTISENITVGPTAGDEFANGMSAGPITIANGFTITIENGGAWSVR
ncbi:hypothetical protein Sn250709_036 [Synechococcus phage S-RIM2]|jgi:hypothetical protein|uniref:Uncharacterized protein n=4 Tax=Nerrivikvirus srim2 TaxID=2734125 RepID=A0A1D7RRI0_9CAUD|nr:hypothetical protein SWTG_00008 [Synechococcus phage S-RIM2 R1_1999]AGH06718.1 hypothetical protein SWRG_00024 [Synechococcus phage S-RIM2 R21_2007]AGH06929.1 hypothetical protein SWUG_00019 [Synechococcus phage S-RIM2 R9_2006]AON97549.1 hypothetical protein Fa020709_036 [Synechococcus phage S-RIM2]AGH07139.1 hypothetical protein SWTG_00008 [Synechococcus phage S-RIM2 R1_1999]AON97763.1 hypothetical protein Fa100709_036 [Synechococcus phage S-RIM2]